MTQALRRRGAVVPVLLTVFLALSCPARLSAQTFILEAETMPVKTTGGPVTDGWNIWSNGSLEDTLTFPATDEYDLQTIARGTPANNGWPIMEIRIDGTTVGTFVVTASSWTTYTFRTSITGGSHRVAVAFTNDAYVPPQDRNLYVDKITLGSVSAPASDTTPPTGSITINGGASATKTAAVTLTLSATDNSGAVAQMQCSNDGETFSTPESYSTTKAWTLTGGEGTKTVWVKFKDAAGNWSAPVSDAIVLDTTPPQLTITSPANGSIVIP